MIRFTEKDVTLKNVKRNFVWENIEQIRHLFGKKLVFTPNQIINENENGFLKHF